MSVEEYLQKGKNLDQSQQNSIKDTKITTNLGKDNKKLFYFNEKNKLIYSFITKTEIESGLDFILSHFNQDKLFSRTIMTEKLGYQKEIFSKTEILEHFTQSKFLDCRINSFPFYTEYKGVQRYPPDLIFIDVDRNNFETDRGLESALYNTLNIKKKLGDRAIPTVLKTGGGYHIILPIICLIPLENITEFQEFDNPSQEFLRFAKDFLSNRKADKNNNPSFKSCLLRIPGSINSKYGNTNKVTIVQKWNKIRAPITKEFLIEFRRYLIQKKIDQEKKKQIQKILFNERRRKKENSSSEVDHNNIKYYEWIEHLLLLQTPIEDFRKLVIDLILAPYLINIKKLSYEESYKIIKDWLDKCNDLKRLDNYRNFVNSRINYALRNAMNKGIPPMSREKIKTDPVYAELYKILQNKGVALK